MYPNDQEEIKIRHLLNHTSGIRDYVELMGLEGQVWWKRFGVDNDDVLALTEKQNDLGFPPGSIKSYSNSNYNLLAEVIERVTEKSFNDYSKKFFQDLGMKETSFVERYMRVIPNRANPYSDWGRGEWWEVPTVTKTNGEGFLFTTLKDQLLFEVAVQNAEQNNNELLIKSQRPIPNSQIKKYGFGLELEDVFGRKAVHHSGGTFGFHSQTYRFPEEKLTVFIMSNNGNISSNLIAQRIAMMLLDPKTKKEQPYDAAYYKEENNNQNIQVVGQYNDPNHDMLIRIVEKDGKIYWQEGIYINSELKLEGKNTYSYVQYPNMKVRFYQDKMIEFYPSGKAIIHRRNTNPPASNSDLHAFTGTYYNSELDLSFDLFLKEGNRLLLKFSNDDDIEKVKVFNKNDLLASESYIINAKRDAFDRIIGVSFSHQRARIIHFTKKTNLKYQPEIPTENGSIQVTTIGSRNGDSSQILMTKNYPNGNEIWYKKFGGKSWDKASSIIDTEDGYLIIGSTSSYGVGNYDMYVIKNDKAGKKLWQNTYGKFDNDYGYIAEKVDNGFIIKGTTQLCNSKDVLNRKCTINVWHVNIDEKGKLISENVLEEVSK